MVFHSRLALPVNVLANNEGCRVQRRNKQLQTAQIEQLKQREPREKHGLNEEKRERGRQVRRPPRNS